MKKRSSPSQLEYWFFVDRKKKVVAFVFFPRRKHIALTVKKQRLQNTNPFCPELISEIVVTQTYP